LTFFQAILLGDTVVDVDNAPLREKLAAINQVAASKQRRLATILFADLVGFTRLSERLDA
jgi:class 3 adenylate cyclase